MASFKEQNPETDTQTAFPAACIRLPGVGGGAWGRDGKSCLCPVGPIPCLRSTPGCQRTPAGTAEASGPAAAGRPSPESALAAGPIVCAVLPDGPLGGDTKLLRHRTYWGAARWRYVQRGPWIKIAFSRALIAQQIFKGGNRCASE